MKPYDRAERLGEQIRNVLAEALLREASDPRLETVTLTAVRLSPDLQHARVYWLPLNPDAADARTRKRLGRAVEGADGFFKSVLKRELDLRFIPELVFEYDDTFERGQRIEELLAEVRPTADDEET